MNNITIEQLAELKEPLNVLVDADYFIFRASSAVQKDIDWGDNLWTCHADAKEAIGTLEAEIEKHVEPIASALGANIYMCLSDPHDNFRKHINPDYKSNRKGTRKPCCYNGVVAWVKDKYRYYEHDMLEADDVIGIMATGTGTKAIIISPDKDFYTIPEAYFFRMTKGTITYSTLKDAEYHHMVQTLMGDVADGYKGCPGFGQAKAQKYLDEALKDKEHKLWYHVVKAYESKGLTEDDALMNARMAKILTKGDVKHGIPVYWTPEDMAY